MTGNVWVEVITDVVVPGMYVVGPSGGLEHLPELQVKVIVEVSEVIVKVVALVVMFEGGAGVPVGPVGGAVGYAGGVLLVQPYLQEVIVRVLVIDVVITCVPLVMVVGQIVV